MVVGFQEIGKTTLIDCLFPLHYQSGSNRYSLEGKFLSTTIEGVLLNFDFEEDTCSAEPKDEKEILFKVGKKRITTYTLSI